MNGAAETAAAALLREVGITEPPVDPAGIAEAVGVHVVSTKMDRDLSGMLVRDAGVPAIGVNADHPQSRRRFTIAHELGHWRMHRGRPLIVDSTVRVNFRDPLSASATNREEIEANAFAAALLMPRSWVVASADVVDAADTEAMARELARKFRVSPQAMTYRLINLGLIDLS